MNRLFFGFVSPFFWCVCLLFCLPAVSQPSHKFWGRWYVTIKIDDSSEYKFAIKISQGDKTTLNGVVSMWNKNNPNEITRVDKTVLTYDKSIQSAYYYGAVKNREGKPCAGYFIFKVNDADSLILDGRFKPNSKKCLTATMIVQSDEKLRLLNDMAKSEKDVIGKRSDSSFSSPIQDPVLNNNSQISTSIAPSSDKSPIVAKPLNEKSKSEIDSGKVNSGTETFVIKPAFITLSSDKEFRWIEWEKAAEDLRIAAKFIKIYKNTVTRRDVTLYEQVQEYLKNNCNVKITALDLDGNGIAGIGISASGSFCCGSRGCTYDLYEDGGTAVIPLGTDYAIKPSLNGVVSSQNKFFKMEPNLKGNNDPAEAQKLFTYEKNKKPLPVKAPPGLLGGVSPAELGKMLLKALQTNNKSLWTNCIHPGIDIEQKSNALSRFQHFRDVFEQEGIDNWSLVNFSRVTFNREPYTPGYIYEFVIEFTYKEFIGTIYLGGAGQFDNKKYYLTTGGSGSAKFSRKK